MGEHGRCFRGKKIPESCEQCSKSELNEKGITIFIDFFKKKYWVKKAKQGAPTRLSGMKLYFILQIIFETKRKKLEIYTCVIVIHQRVKLK